MLYKTLAIIPARGGSKGIPMKNIRTLCGRPLVAWTIAEAKKSKLLDRYIVSTDSEKIAEIAKRYGAEVPFLRPARISKDKSTDIEFILHALDFLKKKEGYEPDIVLRLAPTSPLRTAAHIDEGIRLIVDNPEMDSARAITSAPHHPYKVWKLSADRRFIEPLIPDSVTQIKHPYDQPRQIMPQSYIHGFLDLTRTTTIRKYGNVAGKKIGYFLVPEKLFIDIDNLIDFKIAEIVMRERVRRTKKK